MDELKRAIASFKSKAAGADNFHLQMLKSMPHKTLELVLILFNKLLSTNLFQSCWKSAVVIPLLKQGKSPTSPTNYRPISLLSVIGKIFEVFNSRLSQLLESRNLLATAQHRFRFGHSTQDLLLTIHSYIQESFSRHSHVLAIFFDCTKAFDRVWRHKILLQLHKWGFQSNLPSLICSFLISQNFYTRIGSTVSSLYYLENGVTQGVILSSLLFLIAINDLPSHLQPPVQIALFADDLAVYLRCKSPGSTYPS